MDVSDTSSPISSSSTPRNSLRAVVMPSEHGGWGLTAEPGLLGLLVEPSTAGACIAFAALFAFLVRTPLKLALADRRRGRRLPRTRLAEKVACAEGAVLTTLVATAAVTAQGTAWLVPLLIAAPLVAIELSYDIRSRGRRLVPELAGAAAITSTVTAVVLAGSTRAGLAYGLWLLLAGRAISSIPHVRAQIARSLDRSPAPKTNTLADIGAVILGVSAVVLDSALLVGFTGLAVILVVQSARRHRPVAAMRIVGMIQMAIGLSLVATAALGVAIA